MKKINIDIYPWSFKISGLYKLWFKMRDKNRIKTDFVNELYIYEKN